MGDRVSISFRNGNEQSVVLCSHWGGQQFIKIVESYVEKLIEEVKNKKNLEPLDRLEPETVMVDFIREITKSFKRVDSGLYLGKGREEVDDSDNGHFVVDLQTGEVKNVDTGETIEQQVGKYE